MPDRKPRRDAGGPGGGGSRGPRGPGGPGGPSGPGGPGGPGGSGGPRGSGPGRSFGGQRPGSFGRPTGRPGGRPGGPARPRRAATRRRIRPRTRARRTRRLRGPARARGSAADRARSFRVRSADVPVADSAAGAGRADLVRASRHDRGSGQGRAAAGRVRPPIRARGRARSSRDPAGSIDPGHPGIRAMRHRDRPPRSRSIRTTPAMPPAGIRPVRGRADRRAPGGTDPDRQDRSAPRIVQGRGPLDVPEDGPAVSASDPATTRSGPRSRVVPGDAIRAGRSLARRAVAGRRERRSVARAGGGPAAHRR